MGDDSDVPKTTEAIWNENEALVERLVMVVLRRLRYSSVTNGELPNGVLKRYV